MQIVTVIDIYMMKVSHVLIKSLVTLYECRSVKLAGEVTGIESQTYQEPWFSSKKDVMVQQSPAIMQNLFYRFSMLQASAAVFWSTVFNLVR